MAADEYESLYGGYENTMARKLSGALLGNEFRNRNLVFSPLSIHRAFCIIAAGKVGTDEEQLLEESLRSIFSNWSASLICDVKKMVSYLTSQQDHAQITSRFATIQGFKSPRIQLACSVWFDRSRPLEQRHQVLATDTYNSGVRAVDFKNEMEMVTGEMNNWLQTQSRAVGPQMIHPAPSVELLLPNTLYFQANWGDSYFYEEAIVKRDFHLMDGNTVKVQYISHRLGRNRPRLDCNKAQLEGFRKGFRVLKLDYSNGGPPTQGKRVREFGEEVGRKFSMYILLPDKIDGLPALVEEFRSDPFFVGRNLDFWDPEGVLDYLKDGELDDGCLMYDYDEDDFETGKPTKRLYDRKVEKFWIPKFDISSGFDASTALRQLGQPISASTSIPHQCVVNIDNNGTTTDEALYFESWPTPTFPRIEEDFRADHPFMFIIMEDVSQTVMIVGQVLNPLQ